MIQAAMKGFGPSIYAIFIDKQDTSEYPCMCAVMDYGRPLYEYMSQIGVGNVGGLVAQLVDKCLTASKTGILLLDIKPGNIVVARDTFISPRVMLIDYGTDFAIQYSRGDPNDTDMTQCFQFLNLFLLAMHIKCNGNNSRYGIPPQVVNSMLGGLIRKIDRIQTEQNSLCSLLDGINIEFKKTKRLKIRDSTTNQWVYREIPTKGEIVWPNNEENASYPPKIIVPSPEFKEGEDTYSRCRIVALAFIERLHRYFDGGCEPTFEWDNQADANPLMDQLKDWAKVGATE